MNKEEAGAWRIRDAVAADRDAIADLNAQLAWETESKILDRDVLEKGVARALQGHSNDMRYWVAEDENGEVCAISAVTREWSDWRNGWIWWLQSVYVRPNMRSVGIFKSLHQQIRDDARRDPETIGLRLYVEEHNLRAQEVYRRLGMKPGGYLVYEDLWFNLPK